MRTLLVLLSAGALAGIGGMVPTTTAAAQNAQAWEIGPTVRGRNMSVGMPSTPMPARGGWAFDFPHPRPSAGHVHYVTTRTGSLAGKSKIVMRYRIEAEPGVRLAPRGAPETTAKLALYFQRRGDDWSARGPYEHYRWYATHGNRIPLTPGEHEVSLTLDPRNWQSLASAKGSDVPAQFRAALANAERVGFVLGGGGSAGHGVYATGPARFELLSFRVLDGDRPR